MSRNEPARERHRRLLQQSEGLTEPLNQSPKKRVLNLQNHFGWMAMQKCQVGDGTRSGLSRYPQIVQYHEKPDQYGPDYRKVTYVMFLKGQEEALPKKEKQIQTSPAASFAKSVTTASKVQVIDHPARQAVMEEEQKKKTAVTEGKPHKDSKSKHQDKKDKKDKEDKKDKDDKKKLVDKFYYDKSRDGSASGDRIFRPIDPDEHALPEKNPVVVENYTTDYTPSKKKPKKSKSRTKPKSWQLRAPAGAESGSEAFLVQDEESEDEEDEEEVEAVKPRDARGRSAYRKGTGGDMLWDSPSKTNEYLYISKNRAMRERS